MNNIFIFLILCILISITLQKYLVSLILSYLWTFVIQFVLTNKTVILSFIFDFILKIILNFFQNFILQQEVLFTRWTEINWLNSFVWFYVLCVSCVSSASRERCSSFTPNISRERKEDQQKCVVERIRWRRRTFLFRCECDRYQHFMTKKKLNWNKFQDIEIQRIHVHVNAKIYRKLHPRSKCI